MHHLLRCECGTLQGSVSLPAKASRGICYCNDCQAFAHFLGKAADVLDDMGGTDVIATNPKFVTFSQGLGSLACMSLSERGMLRWYANCCNTPIGNTSRSFKMAHVGLIHSCLEHDASKSLESSFGPVRMLANTKNAKGNPGSMVLSTTASVIRFLISLVRARIDGSYKLTPFFDPEQGTPVRVPKVLTGTERDQVMSTV